MTALTRFARSFSFVGLILGLAFFAASLAPSLLPRAYPVQGALSGIAFAVGYGVGWSLTWFWGFLEIPPLSPRIKRILLIPAVAIALGSAVYMLANIARYQNSIRVLMEMDPLTTAYPSRVAGVALLAALVVLLISRGLIWVGRRVARFANSRLPRKIANALGAAVALLVVAMTVDGVVFRFALVAMDEQFHNLNELIQEDRAAPDDLFSPGGPGSVLQWEGLGRRGRDFVVTGPTQAEIAALTGSPAKRPLRVYAGYGSGETLEDRAEVALQELIRVGGFTRSVLVIATPTGTGWLDPSAVDTLEVLHGGDTAIVALQYSYLPSWTTLIIDPDRSRAAARALFDAIHGYWSGLPEDKRPKLYLFGLSLGALGSEHSANLIKLLTEPIDGALWAGPPFPSTFWQQVTADREPGSPAWLPRFLDGALVRFIGAEGTPRPDTTGWGAMRILYLQYASDPMVFFSPALAWTSPDWLNGRGPDVSPLVRWVPLVFHLQVAFDILMATSVPIGYGHTYAPGDYIDGWITVTDPEGWDADGIAALKAHFRTRTAE